MTDNRMTSAAAQEYLELANRCLIESNRTLDREAADALRHLASRYFKELTATGMSDGAIIRPCRLADDASWHRWDKTRIRYWAISAHISSTIGVELYGRGLGLPPGCGGDQ
jgi:hypothetical protein